MGLKLRRAAFIALTLAAVFLPFRKGRQQEEVSSGDRDVRRVDILVRLDRTRTLWSAMVERDSALSLLAGLKQPSALPVVRLRGFEAGMRIDRVDSIIARLWKGIGTQHPKVGVAVQLYNRLEYGDVFGPAVWRNYWGNLITERDGITWCIAIMPAEVLRGRPVVGRETFLEGIAPCVLLAAFGPPGAGIREWLQSTRYAVARSVEWLRVTGTKAESEQNGPWAWIPSREDWDAGPDQTLSLVTTGARDLVALMAPPYEYGASGLRCVTRYPAACEEVVLDAVAPDSTVPADLTLGWSLLTSRKVGIERLRPPRSRYLSDLILTIGRERFAEVWRSDLPFARSFERVSGTSLGAWTAAWAHRQWEMSWLTREGRMSLILGADLHASWPLLLFVWTGLVLLAAGWTAIRRQVT